MRLSIAQKFLLLLVPIFIVCVTAIVLTARSLQNDSSELAAAEHVNVLVLQSRTYISEMGSALKGFLLNPKDTGEAENKKRADENNGKNFAELKKVAQNPEIIKLVVSLDEMDDKQMNVVEDKVVELVKAGEIEKAREMFIVSYLPIRKLYDELLAELIKRAGEETSDRIQQVVARQRQSATIVIISLVLGLLVLSSALIWTTLRLRRDLRGINSELNSGADEMNSTSTQLGGISEKLADMTSKQASVLQETSSAIAQISAMVEKTSENASRSRTLAAASNEEAQQGKQILATMRNSVQQIDENTESILKRVAVSNSEIRAIVTLISEIGEKTAIINDIVFQTKLLSFNASVEAARAGEHGKGFAVVAEEIGNLAQVSGSAAKDISQMLSGSVEKVESIVQRSQAEIESVVHKTQKSVAESAQTSKEAGDAFEKFAVSIAKLSEMLDEISSAASEQSTGISEVSTATSELNKMMNETVTATTGLSVVAEHLSDQSANLLEVVGSVSLLSEGRRDGGAQGGHSSGTGHVHGHEEAQSHSSHDRQNRSRAA